MWIECLFVVEMQLERMLLIFYQYTRCSPRNGLDLGGRLRSFRWQTATLLRTNKTFTLRSPSFHAVYGLHQIICHIFLNWYSSFITYILQAMLNITGISIVQALVTRFGHNSLCTKNVLMTDIKDEYKKQLIIARWSTLHFISPVSWRWFGLLICGSESDSFNKQTHSGENG